MNFFGLRQTAEIVIRLNDADKRKKIEFRDEQGRIDRQPLYYDGETVAGTVEIQLKPGKKLNHLGIKIEFIGQIEVFYEHGNPHIFTSVAKQLAESGCLTETISYSFRLSHVSKPHETYLGTNVRLRYCLLVTIARRLSDIVKDVDVAVFTLCSFPDVNDCIRMEVGIENSLFIEFEYNRSRYHLEDVIVGRIYFILVQIKIKRVMLNIIRQELTGLDLPNRYTDRDTIATFEIMDGAPFKGESIPIRLFLGAYNLGPTMEDICSQFDVRYYLGLILCDEDDRRYYKQQEITLWRKGDVKALRREQRELASHQSTKAIDQ